MLGISLANGGLLVGDYDFASAGYGLSATTTALLNGSTVQGEDTHLVGTNSATSGTEFTERFTNNATGTALTHADAGVYTTVKLRAKQPTLTVRYEVEANPAQSAHRQRQSCRHANPAPPTRAPAPARATSSTPTVRLSSRPLLPIAVAPRTAVRKKLSTRGEGNGIQPLIYVDPPGGTLPAAPKPWPTPAAAPTM